MSKRRTPATRESVRIFGYVFTFVATTLTGFLLFFGIYQSTWTTADATVLEQGARDLVVKVSLGGGRTETITVQNWEARHGAGDKVRVRYPARDDGAIGNGARLDEEPTTRPFLLAIVPIGFTAMGAGLVVFTYRARTWPSALHWGQGGLRLSSSSVDDATFEVVPPDSAEGLTALRFYLAEALGRVHGRPVTETEIDQALAEDPSDGYVLPDGMFILATVDGQTAGCAGLRFRDGGFAEATRVYVYPHLRGRGLTEPLMARLEELALSQGHTALRLDTHADLIEPNSPYTTLGYRETAAFNDNPYADRWYVKALRSRG